MKIKDFKPDSETKAGLKDQISFRFSELSNAKLSSDEVPSEQQKLPPEGEHDFLSLSDKEIVEIQNKNQSSTLFYNPAENVPSTKNKVSTILPKATDEQITTELQNTTKIRDQVRLGISYLARITYPQDTTLDTQSKQLINFYSVKDEDVSYKLASKGTVLDIFEAMKDSPTVFPEKSFTGFIQPTAQLSFTRAVKAVNPGKIGEDNYIISEIVWIDGSFFRLKINQDLISLGVGVEDSITIYNCPYEAFNNTFTIQSARLLTQENQQQVQARTEIDFDCNMQFQKVEEETLSGIIQSRLKTATSEDIRDKNNNIIYLDNFNALISLDQKLGGSVNFSANKPKIIVSNYNAIASSPILSIILPAGKYSTTGKMRDLLYCSIERMETHGIEIDNNISSLSKKATLTLTPSNYSPLVNNLFFNNEELLGINGNGSVVDGKKQGRDDGGPILLDLVLAVSGYPILLNSNVSKLALSLNALNNLIESEIPQTRIYKPRVEGADAFNYIGNLLKTSVFIYLNDDDKQTTLVFGGVANPGTSIQYRLLTDPQNHYDVEVAISLFASPVKVPIIGLSSKGANSVKLGVSLSSSGNGNGQNEFYFNKSTKVQDSSDKTVYKQDGTVKTNFKSLTELKQTSYYSTVRVSDPIRILQKETTKNQNGEDVETYKEIEKNIVKGAIEKDGLIVLAKPLSMDIISTSTNKYYMEIPQTPLNPNRNYVVKIHAQDRGGNFL